MRKPKLLERKSVRERIWNALMLVILCALSISFLLDTH